MGRLRQTGLNALAGLAAAAVVAILFAAGALDRLEHVSWAWRARLFSDERAAPVPVRLILLDQESLAWAARENGLSWPWPREVYAPLIEWCDAAGAKALFLDVLFTEPSAYGVDDDRALGRALAGSGRTVAAMMAGARGGPTARRPAGVPAVFTFADPTPPPGGRALYPVPDVATNAFCLASVRAEPDSDDVLRRIPLWEAFDGAPIPSPAAALPAAAGELQPVVSSDDGTARVGDRSIPLDRDGLALLRYFGGIERYRPVRAAAVIRSGLMRREGAEPELDPDEFRDAYVLFGFSAPGLKDLRPTPLGGLMPGVGIHAIALENLLRNAFIRPLPPGGRGIPAVRNGGDRARRSGPAGGRFRGRVRRRLECARGGPGAGRRGGGSGLDPRPVRARRPPQRRDQAGVPPLPQPGGDRAAAGRSLPTPVGRRAEGADAVLFRSAGIYDLFRTARSRNPDVTAQ